MSTKVSQTPHAYAPGLSDDAKLGAMPRDAARPGTPLDDTDYKDIQGLVRFGYGHLKAARFHLLTIADAAPARAWLSRSPVTTSVKGTRPDVAVNIAFTYD